LGPQSFYQTPVGQIRAELLSRIGVNFESNTLEFYLLVVRHNSKEDIRVRKELREFRMLRTIAVATSASKEQISYSQADMKAVADTLLDDIIGAKQQPAVTTPEDQRDLRAKQAFLESSATNEKAFTSLDDIIKGLQQAHQTEGA
jgi:hypothetical protein